MYIILSIIVAGILGLCIYFIGNTKANGEAYDEATRLKNDFAFEQDMGFMLSHNVETRIVLIKIRNKSLLKDKYGAVYDSIILNTANMLKKINGRDKTFYLQQGKFALILSRNVADVDAYVKKIFLRLQKQNQFGDFSFKEYAVAAIVNFPQEVRSVGDIYHIFIHLELLPWDGEKTLYDYGYINFAYKKRFGEINEALDRAISTNSFEVFYQPIFGIKEDNIVGCEALLRMNDEKLGAVSPEEFIPVAEKTGKIIDIGRTVINNVFTFLKNNDIEKFNLKYIEINLSIEECLREDLCDYIFELTDKLGIEPSKVSFEIRESALETNQNVIRENLTKLSDRGFCVSLDEYGTGYSTLTYVMTLPFNYVKIDRTILWNAFESNKAMYALCASINMLKDLNTSIVVAGVETENMVETLKSLKCDYLQGFYFARPMPSTEFIDFMSNN